MKKRSTLSTYISKSNPRPTAQRPSKAGEYEYTRDFFPPELVRELKLKAG
jgi:hypothetical protein